MQCLYSVGKRAKVLLSWSGGKDSVVTFFELKSPEYAVKGLISTVLQDEQVVQMHRVPLALIEKQAESLELPLITVPVSSNPSNDEYESKWATALNPLKKSLKLDGVAFGDLFLEDIKTYREQSLSKIGMQSHFPIWGWSSKEVLKAFFGLGFKAIVVAVDTKKLSPNFVGRMFDLDFVEDLPAGIDPCGENGEFHTFVFDGPFFQKTVNFSLGEKYEKDNFAYQELKLA
jgi:uncharacterized protein (TIGR00290 family)